MRGGKQRNGVAVPSRTSADGAANPAEEKEVWHKSGIEVCNAGREEQKSRRKDVHEPSHETVRRKGERRLLRVDIAHPMAIREDLAGVRKKLCGVEECTGGILLYGGLG